MIEAETINEAAGSARSLYIVLATYNGAAYLVEQIESIQSQTYSAWRLLVRDDGSSDATIAILDDYAASDPRIERISDNGDHLGAGGSFSRLAAIAFERGATAVCFADQDDVWFADKLARTVERLQAAEARFGRNRPILVHTDLQVIDGDGRLLHRSFMKFQHIHDSGQGALKTLLVQNYVTGCAMAVNRPLLRLGLPVPDAALMHDWWLALCAAACGSIVFVPVPTMSYRRHGANAVTVRGFWRTLNPLRTNWAALWRTGRHNHAQAVHQAAALLSRVAEPGAGPHCMVAPIKAFVQLHERQRSAAHRAASAWRIGLRSQTLPRTLALYLRLLLWRA
jgi:rhamnosyltransferase